MKTRRTNTSLLKTEGFSLVETMVVVAILMLLVIMVSDFLIGGLRSTTFGYEQDTAVNTARQAANKIAKELREAMGSVSGAYVLNTVATNTLIFFADIDNDSAADRLRYFTQGNELKRGLIVPSGTPLLSYNLADEEITTVAKYLNNQDLPIFTYYDASSTLIADPTASTSRIRMIHILLKINVTPERAPGDYFYETDVQIRNLKDNL